MEHVKAIAGPAAKAIAAALVPLVLFVAGWFAEKLGIPIDIDPEKLSQWISAAIVSLVSAVAVWVTRNRTAEEG